MKRKKTYVDAGVLIGAVRGQADVAVKAMQILDDPAREFVASPFLKLEVLPKAVYEKRQAEVEFYEAFFAAVRHWVTKIDRVVKAAQQHAQTKGLAALDALHIAAAIAAGVDELVTTEKPGKPLHRVTEVRIVSIHGTNGN
jgi:predicted nucleic acid-binding protein